MQKLCGVFATNSLVLTDKNVPNSIFARAVLGPSLQEHMTLPGPISVFSLK